MAKLFAPNDCNSSKLFAISGVCHSPPQVWHETVTPLKKGGVASAAISRVVRAMKTTARNALSRRDWCIPMILATNFVPLSVALYASRRDEKH
jgi:hypothetical protein